jgi:alpha-D-ribose 1-methylphosphonate 5-triphosphate synthase subunit PhnG
VSQNSPILGRGEFAPSPLRLTFGANPSLGSMMGGKVTVPTRSTEELVGKGFAQPRQPKSAKICSDLDALLMQTEHSLGAELRCNLLS